MGKSELDKLFNQVLRNNRIRMPALPQQTMQGGMGHQAKMTVGQKYSKAKRFGLRHESMKKFLSKYAGGLKYGDRKTPIKTSDLLKM